MGEGGEYKIVLHREYLVLKIKVVSINFVLLFGVSSINRQSWYV